MMKYLILLLLCAPIFAFAFDADFSWDRANKYVDGRDMPAEAIGGYLLGVSCNGEELVVYDETNGSAVSRTITELPAGTCYAAIAVYNQDWDGSDEDNISDYSPPIYFDLGGILSNEPAPVINFQFIQ